MFKIEVINLLGDKENHYWMNKEGDDFLQFLPRYFGVPKENISVFKMKDEDKDFYEAYLRSHENNLPDMEEEGAIKVKRKMKAKFKPGDLVDPEEYEKAKEKRTKEFKGLEKQPQFKKNPKITKKDKKDFIEIEEDDELTKDREEIVKEFRGKKMSRWPYDKKGKFLGNIADDEL